MYSTFIDETLSYKILKIFLTFPSNSCLPIPDRDKVRQRGSGAESRARALRADQGLYTQY